MRNTRFPFYYLFIIGAAIGLILPSAPAATGSPDAAPPILKSASELDYPPFALVREDGTADGFSVDLLKAVSRAAGLDVHFVVGPWHDIKQQLVDGRLDVLPLVSYSPERDKVYDFTVPYLRMHGSIFVRKGEKHIRGKSDLKGKEVMVMRGDTAHEHVVKNKLSDKLILTENFEEAMRLLSDGKHDAVVVQQLVGLEILKKLGISNVVDIGNFKELSLKPVDKPLEGFEQKFCIAVKKGDRELQANLNEGLSIVIANGTYNELYNKWFGPILPPAPIPFSRILKYLVFILGPILFLMTITGLWYLRQEVARKTATLNAEIEERKRAEAALRESERRYHELIENIPVGVYRNVPGPNGGFIIANPAIARMFGYVCTEAFLQVPVADLYQNPASRHDFIEKLVSRGQVFREELLLKKKGGIPLCGAVTARAIHGNDGAIAYFDGFIEDITERKQIEARLQQAQKLESIGTLAGGIAHDFNNILFPIIGLSEMLMDDLQAGSLNYENAAGINKAGNRAKDLVKQILAFSRQAKHEKMPVHIQRILKEAITLSRATIPSNIEISPYLQSDCGPVMADPTQLHQIAMNLITNAYHAVEETGGTLSVRLEERLLSDKELMAMPLAAGEYALFSVSDNGCGIAPEIMGKIFEPYFTTKELGKGTGLGLSMVYGIVREHGGNIQVVSELGRGTTVNVYLPLLKGATEIEATGTPLVYETGSERILLVDDEEPIVRLEQMLLERLGYDVTTRTSSIDALAAFKATPRRFDLVITDMNMPNMTGVQLAGELNSIRPGIPVILCSGFSAAIDPKRAEAMGIKGFLMKPVVKSEMAQMVRNVLDAAKNRVH